MLSIEIFPSVTPYRVRGVLDDYRRSDPTFVSITFSFRRTNRYNITVEKCLQYSRMGFYIVPHIPCLNNSCYHLKKIVGSMINNNITTYLLLRGDVGVAKSFDNTIDLSCYIIHTFSSVCIMLPFYYEGHRYFYDINFDIYNLLRKKGDKECFLLSQLGFCCCWDFLIKRRKWICIGLPLIRNIIKIWGLTKAVDIAIPLSIYQLFKNHFSIGYKMFVGKVFRIYQHVHLYTFNNNLLNR